VLTERQVHRGTHVFGQIVQHPRESEHETNVWGWKAGAREGVQRTSRVDWSLRRPRFAPATTDFRHLKAFAQHGACPSHTYRLREKRQKKGIVVGLQVIKESW